MVKHLTVDEDVAIFLDKLRKENKGEFTGRLASYSFVIKLVARKAGMWNKGDKHE